MLRGEYVLVRSDLGFNATKMGGCPREQVILLKGFKDGGHRSQQPKCRNKEGWEKSEGARVHPLLFAGGEGLWSFLRSGRSSTASRCRSRSAGFLAPHGGWKEALTRPAHMMQPEWPARQIHADVHVRCTRGSGGDWDISTTAMSSLAG